MLVLSCLNKSLRKERHDKGARRPPLARIGRLQSINKSTELVRTSIALILIDIQVFFADPSVKEIAYGGTSV